MSSLLKEAIVDAQALREAALKSAESAIVDKYSNEVRETLEKLIEQEEVPLDDTAAEPEMDLGLDAEAPAEPDLGLDAAPLDDEAAVGAGETADDVASGTSFAATDGLAEMEGENLESFPAEGEETEVTIDLGALQEAIQQMQEEIDEEIEISEEAITNVLSEEEEDLEEATTAGSAAAAADAEQMKDLEDSSKDSDSDSEEDEVNAGTMSTNEEIDTDELVDAIMEKLTVDMSAELAGWAGRPPEDTKYEMERELAHRRSTEVEEDLKDLKKAQEELVFENNQIKEQNSQYRQVLEELKGTLQEVNLSNARLLYTNRILKNASLNERQKSKIVEAISKAGSVTEARTIYNTLESAVESTPKSGPKSLSEAITNRSSVIRATRQESQPTDTFSLRMKKLAGIKS
tara:strand:- start:148 stop:1359 length:1212 start_codon:yes stop_codon:yes gene_type:complete